ncbi:MAG: hypothetical protein QXO27_04295 [Candidatus Aenigmatarchaeota archaeon]
MILSLNSFRVIETISMTKKIVKILIILAALLILPYAVKATDIIKGGVGIHIGSSVPKCGNSLSSCGTYPNCINLTGISYCVNGRVVEPYCYANEVKNRTYNKACQPSNPSEIKFELNVTNGAGSKRQLMITLYSPETGNPINTSLIDGYGSLSSTNSIVDFKFEFDASNLSVIIKNLNITRFSSGISNIIVDKPSSVAISGIDIYKAYRVELPTDFTYSTIFLSVSYSGINVRNENGLKFYKCSSFNTVTNTCNGNWSEISSVNRNTANKIVSIEINTFSVYALGEPAQQNTNTNTCDPDDWSECDADCGECGFSQGLKENDCGTRQGCTVFCGSCPSGYTCIDNVCVEKEPIPTASAPVVAACGNDICETGETSGNCCKDCGCSSEQICNVTTNSCYTPIVQTEEEQNVTLQTKQNDTEDCDCPSTSWFNIPFITLWAPASAAAVFFATRWYYLQRINYRPSYIRKFRNNYRSKGISRISAFKYSFKKAKYNYDETRLVL